MISISGGDIFAQSALENAAPQAGLSANFFNFTLPFIPNKGRYDKRVKFSAQLFCGNFFVTENDLTYCIVKTKNKKEKVSVIREVFLNKKNKAIRFSPQPQEESQAKVSYFIGNDPGKWQSGISTYNAVSLGEIYPGIEVKLKASNKNVEKVFYISPGANPSDIKIQVEGARRLKISSRGYLILNTRQWPVLLKNPIAYQAIGEERRNIKVSYRKISRYIYGFTVLGAYDARYPLIIDPTLVYSTYLGGSANDGVNSICIEYGGIVTTYVIGTTWSSNFPTKFSWGAKSGGSDVFITTFDFRYSGTESLRASIYLGGSSDDYGCGIAVDSGMYPRDIYVTGGTSSNNFPTTKNAYAKTSRGRSDAFVAKINPHSMTKAGGLLYSTYLGGRYYDVGIGVAIDSLKNAYVTGYTDSDNFPTKNAYDGILGGVIGESDGFVTKFNPSLSGAASLISSTYLGGSDADQCNAIAVDSSGNACVTGWTISSPFPTTANAYDRTFNQMEDVFVTKLNPTLSSLVYSTYLGGSSADYGRGIAVDSSGNIYVTGSANSARSFNFPTTANAYDKICNNDAFVTKINPSLSGVASLVYSTFLGGSSGANGFGIAIDSSLNVYVTGNTQSSDFPTTENAYSASLNGGLFDTDVFVTKFNPSLSSLVYSTYLGGTAFDSAGAIAVHNTKEDIYVVGGTSSNNFPTIKAYNTIWQGYDAFVAKFSEISFLRAYDGSGVVDIATEPKGTVTSPLRVRKGSTTYGVELVNTTDVNATKIKIRTKTDTKALKKKVW